MEDLSKSSLNFFADQQLCSADILSPIEVRARIEVSVINFLKILNSPDPAISDLPLRRWFYCGIDVIALLHCSRFSLGIVASSRGLVAGRLMLQAHYLLILLSFDCFLYVVLYMEPNEEVIDCSACGSSGYSISGDLSLLEKLDLKTDARQHQHLTHRCLQHAIFQRLTEDFVFNQIPSILITAKGYPDIATRFLLHRLNRAFPDLPILALVDWNPAGLAILCTFKFGSIGMGMEAYRYACNVKWLGLRGDDVQLIPEQSLLPLKPRDLQIARSLMSSEILQENYKEELSLMVHNGQRAEVEALYFHGYDYLGKYIAKKIVQADYI
ncbi:Meiotic recombination protein SPO11-2 [Citrus sinensis]|uniref:Meiotic recombination protein SPO11-2 n=1 Tax=Citrus sinensis TaxID=2711 RepID=A0ACB8LPA5_CITSI|nr:Meiotic recombination protein SPO11-2 [Citrus sinensis]